MFYRVFAQSPELSLDVSAWVRSAQRYFEATLDVLDLRPPDPAVAAELGAQATIRLASRRRHFEAVFEVSSRHATSDDWQAAQRAEQRGRAGGMSLLAARCPTVWELRPKLTEVAPSPGEPVGSAALPNRAADANLAATLNLCALLASVALGPVLPPDESTLFGIRGAMERLDALTGPSLAR